MTPQEKARQLRPMIVKASASLSDEDALSAVELFKAWAADTAYAADERIRYGDKLYRCVQAHTSQTDWAPDTTPALWTEVAKPGQGETPDNPIPYNNNMALGDGKYYSQYGVVYVCTRSTGAAVYNDLKDLVGIYVNVWEG